MSLYRAIGCALAGTAVSWFSSDRLLHAYIITLLLMIALTLDDMRKDKQ